MYVINSERHSCGCSVLMFRNGMLSIDPLRSVVWLQGNPILLRARILKRIDDNLQRSLSVITHSHRSTSAETWCRWVEFHIYLSSASAWRYSNSICKYLESLEILRDGRRMMLGHSDSFILVVVDIEMHPRWQLAHHFHDIQDMYLLQVHQLQPRQMLRTLEELRFSKNSQFRWEPSPYRPSTCSTFSIVDSHDKNRWMYRPP